MHRSVRVADESGARRQPRDVCAPISGCYATRAPRGASSIVAAAGPSTLGGVAGSAGPEAPTRSRRKTEPRLVSLAELEQAGISSKQQSTSSRFAVIGAGRLGASLGPRLCDHGLDPPRASPPHSAEGRRRAEQWLGLPAVTRASPTWWRSSPTSTSSACRIGAVADVAAELGAAGVARPGGAAGSGTRRGRPRSCGRAGGRSHERSDFRGGARALRGGRRRHPGLSSTADLHRARRPAPPASPEPPWRSPRSRAARTVAGASRHGHRRRSWARAPSCWPTTSAASTTPRPAWPATIW